MSRNKGRRFGYSPIGGIPMHPCITIDHSHPDFAAVAAQVTPIRQVHQLSHPKTFFESEPVRAFRDRRFEDVNKLR